ncbi:MAG TPA: hypothetical protein VNY36_06040, partial [Bacteroidia bacterium]|nr:hypothetical protein [Bacteroidia bacterium]
LQDKPVEFRSGNWLHFKIREDEFNGALVELIGADAVMFGQTIDGDVKFLVWDRVKDYIKVGSKFAFLWGPNKILGEAEVIEIIR